ncbi:hypothetical protein L6452_44153 [Arctium lappa]|uniref:Uncharacterized protein n=1 Tax=Arctium lappa TaxID=4217 RepID=A0ACB8XF41_ARCLA|nr:hypothetical protein L6452_44153 [Arctium lappa]
MSNIWIKEGPKPRLLDFRRKLHALRRASALLSSDLRRRLTVLLHACKPRRYTFTLNSSQKGRCLYEF